MPAEQIVRIKLTCDGPRCSHGTDGKPIQVSWDPEKSKTDPYEIPDAAWSFFTVVGLLGNSMTFCRRRCEHDWQLDNPFTLKTPRELAAQQAAEQEVQARQSKVPVVPPITPPLAFGGEPLLEDHLTDESKLYEGGENAVR